MSKFWQVILNTPRFNLTPSNRRHVSQYDLASPAETAKLLCTTCKQRSCVQEWLIRCWRRAFWWMRVERLFGRLLNRWRLKQNTIRLYIQNVSCAVCMRNWGRSDGFTLHPGRLANDCGWRSGTWIVFVAGTDWCENEGRSVCGLFMGSVAWKGEERRFSWGQLKGSWLHWCLGADYSHLHQWWIKNLMTVSIRRITWKVQIESPEWWSTRRIFQFHDAINLLFTKRTSCSEDEFIEGFRGRPENENWRSIEMLERWRMEMGDRVRRDFKGFIEENFSGLAVKEERA